MSNNPLLSAYNDALSGIVLREEDPFEGVLYSTIEGLTYVRNVHNSVEEVLNDLNDISEKYNCGVISIAERSALHRLVVRLNEGIDCYVTRQSRNELKISDVLQGCFPLVYEKSAVDSVIKGARSEVSIIEGFINFVFRVCPEFLKTSELRLQKLGLAASSTCYDRCGELWLTVREKIASSSVERSMSYLLEIAASSERDELEKSLRMLSKEINDFEEVQRVASENAKAAAILKKDEEKAALEKARIEEEVRVRAEREARIKAEQERNSLRSAQSGKLMVLLRKLLAVLFFVLPGALFLIIGVVDNKTPTVVLVLASFFSALGVVLFLKERISKGRFPSYVVGGAIVTYILVVVVQR